MSLSPTAILIHLSHPHPAPLIICLTLCVLPSSLTHCHFNSSSVSPCVPHLSLTQCLSHLLPFSFVCLTHFLPHSLSVSPSVCLTHLLPTASLSPIAILIHVSPTSCLTLICLKWFPFTPDDHLTQSLSYRWVRQEVDQTGIRYHSQPCLTHPPFSYIPSVPHTNHPSHMLPFSHDVHLTHKAPVVLDSSSALFQ